MQEVKSLANPESMIGTSVETMKRDGKHSYPVGSVASNYDPVRCLYALNFVGSTTEYVGYDRLVSMMQTAPTQHDKDASSASASSSSTSSSSAVSDQEDHVHTKKSSPV